MALLCRLGAHAWYHRWLDDPRWSECMYRRTLGWVCGVCGTVRYEHRWAFMREAGAIQCPEDEQLTTKDTDQ